MLRPSEYYIINSRLKKQKFTIIASIIPSDSSDGVFRHRIREKHYLFDSAKKRADEFVSLYGDSCEFVFVRDENNEIVYER